MFEESLLESAHLLRTRSRWPAVTSFAVQAAIAATIITVPLLHPDILPLRAAAFTLTPPAPIPPKPPHPQRVHAEASASAASAVPTTSQQSAQIPTLNPNAFSDTPPTIGTISMVGVGPALGAAMSPSNSGPNVVVATPSKPGPPTRISQGVSEGLLLAPVQPVYPRIAIAAHREGTVVIHAIISKTGAIESANAVSGPIMLQGAALEAVRAARYRPYRLNGEPTDVDTTFSIVFRLNS
ncbi:MAG: energy transducer TonB [Acidobacteriota bacterium]|nr:energy transducer TonB [Acidobacteriota bacterium]